MGYPYPNPNPKGEKKNALVRTGLAIDPRPLPIEPLYIELVDDLLFRPPPNPKVPLRVPYAEEKEDPRMPPMRPPLLAADAGLATAKFSSSAPATMLRMRLRGNRTKTVLMRVPNDGADWAWAWARAWDDTCNEEAGHTHRVDVGPCLPGRIAAAGHRCTNRLAHGIDPVGPRAVITVAVRML